MTALPLAVLDRSAALAGRPETPADAWHKAMAKYQAVLQRAERASKAHSDADEAMFAARNALEVIKPLTSLTVQTNCERYFDGGLRAPIERRYSNDVELRDEVTIRAYAKDDEKVCSFLLEEFGKWRERRTSAEAAYEKAKAASAAREAASAVAMDRSDARQLRLLCTPRARPRSARIGWSRHRDQVCRRYR